MFLYIYGVSFGWVSFFSVGFLEGLHGYLMCDQMAFGVVVEIPGPLFYGAVRVEYAFGEGGKIRAGSLVGFAWAISSRFMGRQTVVPATACAHCKTVFCIGIKGWIDGEDRIG